MLNAIDTGLSDLFAVARKNRYSRKLNYSDYTIFIGRADRTKDSQKRYSPDIAVNAGQYANTDYDQGGFIYAAGMVIGYNPNAFLIAEHTKDFQRVSEVVRFRRRTSCSLSQRPPTLSANRRSQSRRRTSDFAIIVFIQN